MPFSEIDLALTLLSGIILFQFAWLSVMMLRRGISPETIATSLPSTVAIWVILWPLYEASIWVWGGVIILGAPILLAYGTRLPFWLQLRLAWSGKPLESEVNQPLPHMWPLVSLMMALAVAAAYFQRAPEFGFGMALSTCLAFPVAAMLDRLGVGRLGFPLHPEQTLIGHIALILSISLICSWTIRLYHGFDWSMLMMATLIAGLIASFIRSLAPTLILQPLAILAVGATLWLL